MTTSVARPTVGRVRRTSTTRYLARYVAGRPLSGRRITNATFLHAGDYAYDQHARLTRWQFRPGYQRAAWRLGLPAALVATLDAYATHPLATEATGGTLAATGAAYGSLRAVRAVRLRRHTARYVRPLAAVLARQLGLPASTPAARIVSIPLDYREPGRTIRVALPAVMPDAPDAQRTIARTVAAKLGLDLADLDAAWHMVGAEPYATFTRAPRPPKKVAFSDVLSELRASSSAAPVLGIGARGKVMTIDLDSDAPHVAISCGSGAGKSVLVRGIIAQFLHNGAQVIVNDGKRISQSWCKDIPGVTYNRTGEQMHNTLLAIAAEVDRRNELIDSVPTEQEDSVDVGPRLIVVFEEQNVGVTMLAEYWQSIRTKTDPKRSPALAALDYILCTGRQVRTHVVSVAQMFTVQAAGGNPSARENYGCRILARATRNAWVMLAPEAAPFPKASRTRGRMHVVIAGVATEFQTVLMSPGEAREWATTGAAVTVPVDWTGDTYPGQAGRPGQADSGTSGPVYTLAEASRAEWCPLNYEALKKVRQRAASWPEGRRDGARERWTEGQLRAALGLDSESANMAP